MRGRHDHGGVRVDVRRELYHDGRVRGRVHDVAVLIAELDPTARVLTHVAQVVIITTLDGLVEGFVHLRTYHAVDDEVVLAVPGGRWR